MGDPIEDLRLRIEALADAGEIAEGLADLLHLICNRLPPPTDAVATPEPPPARDTERDVEPPLCARCDHIEALHAQADTGHAFVPRVRPKGEP